MLLDDQQVTKREIILQVWGEKLSRNLRAGVFGPGHVFLALGSRFVGHKYYKSLSSKVGSFRTDSYADWSDRFTKSHQKDLKVVTNCNSVLCLLNQHSIVLIKPKVSSFTFLLKQYSSIEYLFSRYFWAFLASRRVQAAAHEIIFGIRFIFQFQRIFKEICHCI